MWQLNNKNKNHYFIAATTISILAIAIIMVPSTSLVTQAAAQQTTTTTTAGGNTTSSGPSSSGIKLSSQPIYQERSPPGNITPINQTHGVFTFTGNGTLTLPNSTQTINTTHNGTAFISFTTSSGYGREIIRTQDGETVNATLYEIVQSNPATPEVGKGIITAVFQTNSTRTVAPLNGMILAGIDDMSASGESHVTLWKWESGIVNTSANANSSNANNNSTAISADTAPSPTTQGAPSLENSSISNAGSNANTLTILKKASPSPAPSTSLTAP